MYLTSSGEARLAKVLLGCFLVMEVVAAAGVCLTPSLSSILSPSPAQEEELQLIGKGS